MKRSLLIILMLVLGIACPASLPLDGGHILQAAHRSEQASARVVQPQHELRAVP